MLTLAITGFEADPDRVTDLLGLVPTRVGRKGVLSRSRKPRSFNGWWLEAPENPMNDGAQHDEALSWILAQIRGKEDLFTQLREVIAPTQITIYGSLHPLPEEQCGVWLHLDQMRLLADCGIDWGLDIF